MASPDFDDEPDLEALAARVTAISRDVTQARTLLAQALRGGRTGLARGLRNALEEAAKCLAEAEVALGVAQVGDILNGPEWRAAAIRRRLAYGQETPTDTQCANAIGELQRTFSTAAARAKAAADGTLTKRVAEVMRIARRVDRSMVGRRPAASCRDFALRVLAELRIRPDGTVIERDRDPA